MHGAGPQGVPCTSCRRRTLRVWQATTTVHARPARHRKAPPLVLVQEMDQAQPAAYPPTEVW